MSEAAQGALIGGGFVFAVSVANLVYNHLARGRERDEGYRLALYDKRLAVHQQAFEWLMKAGERLKRAQRQDAKQEDRDELADVCERADQWWNANCLYLDPISWGRMLTFIFETRLWAKDPTHEPPEGHPRKLHREAVSAVKEGIGLKHIDPKLLDKKFEQ